LPHVQKHLKRDQLNTGYFDEQWVQKGGLKGALVVVEVVVVATTTVLPSENFVALGRLLLNQN